MQHEVSIDIAAPSDIVWSVLADVERWPSWTRSVRSVELLDRTLAAGARVRIRQPRFPTVVWQVTAVQTGRSFTWQSKSPGASATGHHEVLGIGDGSSTAVLRITQTGPLGSVFGLLTRRVTKRYVAMEAQGLKQKSEAVHQFLAEPREVW